MPIRYGTIFLLIIIAANVLIDSSIAAKGGQATSEMQPSSDVAHVQTPETQPSSDVAYVQTPETQPSSDVAHVQTPKKQPSSEIRIPYVPAAPQNCHRTLEDFHRCGQDE
jgi:hypothetical protein